MYLIQYAMVYYIQNTNKKFNIYMIDNHLNIYLYVYIIVITTASIFTIIDHCFLWMGFLNYFQIKVPFPKRMQLLIHLVNYCRTEL